MIYRDIPFGRPGLLAFAVNKKVNINLAIIFMMTMYLSEVSLYILVTIKNFVHRI